MLAELLISAMCASTPGTYSVACNKASTATFITVGASEKLSMVENATTKQVVKVTGDTVWGVGGVAVKVVKEKQLKYRIRTHKNLIDTDYITPGIEYKDGSKGASILFGWIF